jgi:hypothetical protein
MVADGWQRRPGAARLAWSVAYLLLMESVSVRTTALLDADTAEVLREAAADDIEELLAWLEDGPEEEVVILDEIARRRERLALLR